VKLVFESEELSKAHRTHGKIYFRKQLFEIKIPECV